MKDNPYLCSFHIPKTGGTTFAYHARKSLGDEEFFLHGPFARVERFLHNQPQFEELPDNKKEIIKIVHGHGAGLTFAESMSGRMPEFMVILRDPYERFVSGFHHFKNERRNAGLGAVSETRYLQSRGKNFYARALITNFGPLSPSEGEVSLDKLIPLIQSFKYILVTEHLNRQLQQVYKLYALEIDAIEAQRVNTSKSELATKRADFDKLNQVDTALYSILADAAARSDSAMENPFGYRPEVLRTYLTGAWSKQTQEDRLVAAYDDLINACKITLKLQALHSKLTDGTTSHVADKQLLLERVNAAMTDWLENLTDEKSSVAHFWSGIMFMKEGNLNVAEDYLQKAVRLNPQNDNALAHLAKVLHRRGKKGDAMDYINRAWAIRPDRPATQNIRKAIIGKI